VLPIVNPALKRMECQPGVRSAKEGIRTSTIKPDKYGLVPPTGTLGPDVQCQAIFALIVPSLGCEVRNDSCQDIRPQGEVRDRVGRVVRTVTEKFDVST